MLALLLTFFAGLSTVIGGFIGVHKNLLKKQYLSLALSFSAGAMVYISLAELIPSGFGALSESHTGTDVFLVGFVAFLGGIVAAVAIDKLIPHGTEIDTTEDATDVHTYVTVRKKRKLLRSGLIMAVILAIHNFPEGIVTYTGAMRDLSLGISLAAAIALHNIPEGIAIAAPIYAATNNRSKAIFYALISGLLEPIGAVVGYVVLSSVMSPVMMGVIFTSTAGMMIYVGAVELMPAARRYEASWRRSSAGFVAGCVVMLVSIWMLALPR